jgi:tetratricopeptide (TPR) repeat protein
MSGLDVFDVVAVILGVIFTIRKLDAQRREPKEFSHVEEGAFLAWRRKETRIYTTGMATCFAKVLGKVVATQWVAPRVSYGVYRAVGAAIDISWFVIVIVTLVAAYRMAIVRAQLRIVLGGFVVADKSALTGELREAISDLKSGQVERAAYLFRQIALDADESHKAIATYYLGEAFLLQGKTDEARDAFQESLEIDPSLNQPAEALARLDRAYVDASS